MSKYVVKVSTGAGNYRINLPREIIQLKRWGDVKFVLVENNHRDTITIRRFVDGKALDGKDSQG